jgi:hypothetical protein
MRLLFLAELLSFSVYTLFKTLLKFRHLIFSAPVGVSADVGVPKNLRIENLNTDEDQYKFFGHQHRTVLSLLVTISAPVGVLRVKRGVTNR